MVNWIQVIGALIGVFFTGIMLDAPKKFLPFSAFVGGLGWACYLYLLPQHGPLAANYFAGLLVALGAHTVARIGKTPVLVILIPGFYPLVPGVGMYRTILYLIQGEMDKFQANLQLTLLIAAMIALSIFTVDSVVNTFFRVRRMLKKEPPNPPGLS